MHQTSPAEAAIAYAEAGWLVFPAPPGTKMSFKSAARNGGRRWGATRDPEEISHDFARWPQANVCIVTGKDNKIWVMDIDSRVGHEQEGFAALAALEAKFGPLPLTRQARSPSGSLHYYWSYPSDCVIRNDTGRKLGPGIDVRGDGGMVVAPPSLKNGEPYIWLNAAPIIPAPDWLKIAVGSREIHREQSEENYGVVPIPYLIDCMAAVPTQLDWQSRNNIGMAVFNASGGSETGKQIWKDWLARSGRFNAVAADRRWIAFHSCPPTMIGFGTLHHLATAAHPAWERRFDNKQIKIMMSALRKGKVNDLCSDHSA